MKINIHQSCKRTIRIPWILLFPGTFLFSCSQVQGQSKIKEQASNGGILTFPKSMEAIKNTIKINKYH